MSVLAYAVKPEPVKSLDIDERQFLNTFRQSADYHDEIPPALYLDLETGQVCAAGTQNDSAAKEATDLAQERVWSFPSRYWSIRGLSHSGHRHVLRAFLDSDWTQDTTLKKKARSAYSTTVGRWIKDVNDPNIVAAYFRYRDDHVKRTLTESLLRRGIATTWKTGSSQV